MSLQDRLQRYMTELDREVNPPSPLKSAKARLAAISPLSSGFGLDGS
jgi:hypothetical protein